MERDFRQEFIELKQNETPDLWNRIEAGLSERKITAYAPEKANFSEKITGKNIHWRRWGSLAAACLCVAVIIPALSLIIRNSTGKNSSGTADNSTAENMSGGTMMDYESSNYAPAEEETAMSGGTDIAGSTNADTARDDAGTMSGGNEEGIQAGINADNNSSISEKQDGMSAENSSVAASEEANDASETETAKDLYEHMEAVSDLKLKNGQVIENVTIQIVEANASGEEIIYQAVVLLPDADAVLKKNMQIEIVCNQETEYDFSASSKGDIMKEGENYEVSLCYEQEKLIVTSAANGN